VLAERRLVELGQAHLADGGRACSSCTPCGRVDQPSRFMPSAIAPLETMTSSRCCPTSAAICRHQPPTAAGSTPRPRW
jgi:hypothetical protein